MIFSGSLPRTPGSQILLPGAWLDTRAPAADTRRRRPYIHPSDGIQAITILAKKGFKVMALQVEGYLRPIGTKLDNEIFTIMGYRTRLSLVEDIRVVEVFKLGPRPKSGRCLMLIRSRHDSNVNYRCCNTRVAVGRRGVLDVGASVAEARPTRPGKPQDGGWTMGSGSRHEAVGIRRS